MCQTTAPTGREQGQRPSFEVAQIFRDHGEAYRQSHRLSPEQRQAMRDIEACRTAALGGHLDHCLACGFERPSFNSCRNRNCPKCGSLAQARWLEERTERVLPVHHFHLVFTLPAELRPLIYQNQERLYALLFCAASQALLEVAADPQYLGARPGITAVLHTWTRELAFHPHLHCIVTGGGLSLDGERWVESHPRFLFPVRILAARCRRKFIDGLCAMAQELTMEGACADLRDPVLFALFKDKLYRKRFNVHCKPPFGGPEHLLSYLGRYTHRVALSNQRIINYDGQGVCFATRDGKSVTLPPLEFIRRFLLHVLPKGFVKVRHYGLAAAAHVGSLLERARELLAEQGRKTPPPPPRIDKDESDGEDAAQDGDSAAWEQLFARLTGIDLRRCPHCQRRSFVRYDIPSGRAPP